MTFYFALKWLVTEVGTVLWNTFIKIVEYIAWPAKEIFNAFLDELLQNFQVDWTIIIQYGYMLDAFLPLEFMYNSLLVYVSTYFMCFGFRLVIKLGTVGRG